MKRRRPEQGLQRAVFEHLRIRATPGVFAFHVPNGGARSPIEAKILKGQGVVAGVPDILAIKDGVIFGLELKAEGGRLSPAQAACHAALRAAGATVTTAVGLDHALGILEGWRILKGTAGLRRPMAGLSTAVMTATV
jgi:hypothetical protein